jgi:hypothetical protein
MFSQLSKNIGNEVVLETTLCNARPVALPLRAQAV